MCGTVPDHARQQHKKSHTPLANVIALTIGTGIGAGVILNGELRRGATGIAGEAGHIIVNPSGGERCGCGATGCLEAMASGTALGRLGRRGSPPSRPRRPRTD